MISSFLSFVVHILFFFVFAFLIYALAVKQKHLLFLRKALSFKQSPYLIDWPLHFLRGYSDSLGIPFDYPSGVLYKGAPKKLRKELFLIKLLRSEVHAIQYQSKLGIDMLTIFCSIEDKALESELSKDLGIKVEMKVSKTKVQ